ARYGLADLPLLRPGISPTRCTPCELERCCRSPWLAVGRCCCCHGCCQLKALYDGYLLPLETARTLQGMGPRPVRAGSCLALGLWPEGCRGSDAQGRVLTIISAERV